MQSKLILIEGIPGVGKTTTARAAAEWLGAHGLTARLHLEGDLDHPADFESVACLDQRTFRGLLGRFTDWQAALTALAQAGPDGEVFISYRKLTAPPAELLDALAARDVYGLPEADFCRVTLARWQSFAAAAAQSAAVFVFECCLLQNQLTTLMAVHDSPPARIEAHLGQIAAGLAPLAPLVIYLDPPAVRAGLARAAAERPPEWAEFVSAYTTTQAWGLARGVSGFEGMAAFYQARRDLEAGLFPRLFPRGLWLRDAGADWPAARAAVRAALGAAFDLPPT